MQAGDALWRLYGLTAVLEQLYPTDPKVGCLAAEIKNCTGSIGAHIEVPEPSSDDLIKIMAVIRGDLPEGVAPPAAATAAKTSGRDEFSGDEIIRAAQAFVGAMVESQLFDWANMVSDINAKLVGDAPFFTFRQAKALLNIAAKGQLEDGPDFLTQMEDDYPEATRAMKEWGDKA